MTAAWPTWARFGRDVVSNLAAGEAIYPFYVSLKVTRRCPLRCAFCGAWASDPVDEIGTEQIKRIVRNIARGGPLVLVVEGGEPTLRDDIGEILSYATGVGLITGVVTALPTVDRLPVLRRAHYVQISIDEGHGNLHLLGSLRRIVAELRVPTGIQTVVRREDLGRVEEKVLAAHECGVRIVVMPAVDLELGSVSAPGRAEFVEAVAPLKKRFPRTVATSDYFLRAYGASGRCSTASVIIDADGRLFYPCHVLGAKPVNLLDHDLRGFLQSAAARDARVRMRSCRRWCGWYQYFTLSCSRLADVPADVRTALERRWQWQP